MKGLMDAAARTMPTVERPLQLAQPVANAALLARVICDAPSAPS